MVDSTKITIPGDIADINLEFIHGHKFGPLQGIENFFINAGISQNASDAVTFFIACAILAVIIWLADKFGVIVMSWVIKKTGFKSGSLWIENLYKRKFFHRSIRIIPTIIAISFSNALFAGYNYNVVYFTTFILQSVVTFMSISIISAFLDVANDVYDEHVKEKSIKGYIQTAKIIIWIIAIIVLMSIMLNIKPGSIILGIGTSAAIFSLVFKDLILGFIASIQLSAQDMIRRGDWITMPTREADGEIQEITLTTVKVKNWDNTETMVPIYTMISESFTNWRSMRESNGRRFLRQIHIDISSVKIMDGESLVKLENDKNLKQLYGKARKLLEETNTSTFITNLGLFRCYAEEYLYHHPNINPEPRLTVRYLPQTDNGIIIELYAFSREKLLIPYQKTISDILEHLIAVASVFELNMFQLPSGRDISRLKE